MEARARRRTALLSSHVCPTPPVSETKCFSPLSLATCSSSSDAAGDKQQGDCVFCKIVRGEAPALKVVAEMCSKVPLISNAVMKATESDSFNLLVNNGAAAGQVVFHTHIHIIPRKASDCLWASESLRRRKLKLDHEALQLAYSIREKLPFFDNLEDSKGQGSSLTHS